MPLAVSQNCSHTCGLLKNGLSKNRLMRRLYKLAHHLFTWTYVCRHSVYKWHTFEIVRGASVTAVLSDPAMAAMVTSWPLGISMEWRCCSGAIVQCGDDGNAVIEWRFCWDPCCASNTFGLAGGATVFTAPDGVKVGAVVAIGTTRRGGAMAEHVAGAAL